MTRVLHGIVHGKTAAGLLAEEWTDEDDRILERIQAERKAAKWRELPE